MASNPHTSHATSRCAPTSNAPSTTTQPTCPTPCRTPTLCPALAHRNQNNGNSNGSSTANITALRPASSCGTSPARAAPTEVPGPNPPQGINNCENIAIAAATVPVTPTRRNADSANTVPTPNPVTVSVNPPSRNAPLNSGSTACASEGACAPRGRTLS